MPNVDSAVIHLELIPKNEQPKNPKKILQLAKIAFSQKRKKLSNTLKEILPKLKELNLQDLRPEHLSIKDWEKLAE
jgi:16S rRNA A1518/A1519 N6-dimethyltransferase RsmA/KsgA/DIM1 with predicted DNA glycosylase/AP lyase activity